MGTSFWTTSMTRTSGAGAAAGLARSQPLPATTASTASVATHEARLKPATGRYRALRGARAARLATADATSRPGTRLSVAAFIGLLLVGLLTKPLGKRRAWRAPSIGGGFDMGQP